jgi:hypothetical protein
LLKESRKERRRDDRSVDHRRNHRRYPDEFVLIGDPVTDESLEVLSGAVLYHGKDRQRMYRAAKALPAPKRIATHYTGELFDPDTVSVL